MSPYLNLPSESCCPCSTVRWNLCRPVYFAPDYVDNAVRHVMMRQGVLGVTVSIMLPHDPTVRTVFRCTCWLEFKFGLFCLVVFRVEFI